MSITDMMERRVGRLPLARFYSEPVEDRVKSAEAGKAVMVDQDWVEVTAAYSKDSIAFKVKDFFERNRHKVAAGEMPQEWDDLFKRQYAAWKNGQELPLDGTPILGWAILSPAMQKNIINTNIRTVEDLAAVNDEGMRRLGMGAQDLKNKARAWLEQSADKGPLTMKMAAVEKENALLKGSVDALQAKVAELVKRLELTDRVASGDKASETEITVDDIFEPEVKPTKRKAGR